MPLESAVLQYCLKWNLCYAVHLRRLSNRQYNENKIVLLRLRRGEPAQQLGLTVARFSIRLVLARSSVLLRGRYNPLLLDELAARWKPIQLGPDPLLGLQLHLTASNNDNFLGPRGREEGRGRRSCRAIPVDIISKIKANASRIWWGCRSPRSDMESFLEGRQRRRLSFAGQSIKPAQRKQKQQYELADLKCNEREHNWR